MSKQTSKDIDLKPHEHSHTMQITPLNKRVFWGLFAIWIASVFVTFGLEYTSWIFGAFSFICGGAMIAAHPKTWIVRDN